ncbi:MAG: DNA topoisomerase I [Candidatus Rehaiarchaeum fermentans]|nr:DNA topoisomerase I [Candidatus Rehaiarchaeum fermentans]
MILIVAEKSTAAETIAKEIGEERKEIKDGNIRYWKIKFKGEEAIVFPLKGHIVDVDFGDDFKNWDEETIKNLYKAEIVYYEKEKEIINKLREIGKNADLLIIATDYDSEGESIGLEAAQIVKAVNPKIKVKRALFSALTKKELNEAFSNLTEINENLANSANARREIDLLIGATLTRLLSVSSGRLGNAFLSVGRVQTPTLKLVVERENEIESFKREKYYVMKFETENGIVFSNKEEYKSKDEIDLKEGEYKLKIIEIKTKEKEVPPPVPFNTTEFLEAAASIGFSIPNAMRIAEDLYMRGYISYPRTDNQTYPPTLNFKEILEELSKEENYKKYIENEIDKNNIKPTRGKEALDHPPIYPIKIPSDVDKQEIKIFNLIARRFLATLSKPEKEILTKITGEINEHKFYVTGKKIIYKGWKEIYPIKENEIILPEISKNELDGKLIIEEKQTSPPPRYTQAKTIKKMEELGLGTKSTRAEIIKKLFERGYLSKGSTLFASELGRKIIHLLDNHSPVLTSPELTANLEKEIEDIANSKKEKEKVVLEAREQVKTLVETMIKFKNEIKEEVREAIKAQYIIGKCPKCNSNLVLIRSLKTKKQFLGCSNYPKCNFSLPITQRKIQVLPQKCPKCDWHLVKIYFKRPLITCINPDCEENKLKKFLKKDQQN